MSYQIITDATCDINAESLAPFAPVKIIPMDIMVGDDPYLYGEGGNITITDFYKAQRGGKFCSTSQINPMKYKDYFEAELKDGKDVIYFSLTSGLSGSYANACMIAEELMEEYPGRKVYCVETFAASVGLGLMVREAARLQTEGMDAETLFHKMTENRLNICHWFTVDTFDHLRHGGRVSAAAAAMGTVLNIKPMLRIANDGTLETKDKPRGRKRAMMLQIKRFQEGWMPELSNYVLVGHADDIEAANDLKALIQKTAPGAHVEIADIGPVIGAHVGPGMLAIIYWGSNR